MKHAQQASGDAEIAEHAIYHTELTEHARTCKYTLLLVTNGCNAVGHRVGRARVEITVLPNAFPEQMKLTKLTLASMVSLLQMKLCGTT